ncbi:restriction endonuclease subunit R [Mycobacterium xenopi]|nr:restriction endonuclease subunit R [Mycobacterium xenopi]SPX94940.1 putative helicase [Mycobacterium xenopi]
MSSVIAGSAGLGVAARVARTHQLEAMDALDTVLTARSRAQLVMACGTGKTLVGRWYAERVGAAVTVVVVPSLSLVAQTLQEWRSAPGWRFEALITCSDPSTADGERERVAADGQDVGAPFWASPRARVTTSAGVVAQRLAGHSADRPLVVFSTYHSVHVVAQAARAAQVTVDLVIADEGHNLAGQPRREFRVVLGDELAARARVFMTATPVVTAAGAAGPGFDDWSAPLSMDDEDLFGPVAYRLDFAEAIARDLLSDYRVLVYETCGQQLTPDPVAALTAAAQQGVGSVLSFHGRVAKARAFAAALDGLRLPDGRRVVARAVAGVDPTAQRAQALSLLASARPDQLVVVASARCLSAGVDIPAVDGVLFADPKYSDVDVVQSVGRALRPAPAKTAGVVMIPVCVPPDFDEDSVLSTGSFAAVWRILRGLRSMDARLAGELEMLSRTASRRGVCDGSRRLARVHFDVPSIDGARLQVRVVDFLSPAWDKMFAELEVFAYQHGHARPRRATRLGEWCERQRRAYRSAMLAPERAQRLRALPGWAWDLAEQRWLDQYRQVREVAAHAGGLNVDDPAMAEVALRPREPRSRICTLGRWCAQQRQLARRGDLDPWRKAKLDEIAGWRWAVLDPYDAEAVDLLGEYVAWKGHANPPADVVEDDVALGQWLNGVRRRRATGRLGQSLLDEIAIVCPSSESDGALRWYRPETLWLLVLRRCASSPAGKDIAGCQAPMTSSCPTYRCRCLTGAPANATTTGTGKCLRRGHGWKRLPGGSGSASRPHVCCSISAMHAMAPAPDTSRAAAAQNAPPPTGARKSSAALVPPRADRPPISSTPHARGRLRHLVAQGAEHKSLARACGLNVKTIAQIISGETKRILPETEQAIRALSLAGVRAAAAPGTRVPAGPTWELLDDMIARGWPKAWIARELGFGNALQLSTDTVTAANADKVAELAERLADRMPPPRRGRQPLPSLSEILAAEHTNQRQEEVA